VLRAGKIEQVGSPRELFETPANAFVARFVGVDAMIRPETVEPGDKVWTAVVNGRRIPCTPPRRRAIGDGYLLALRPERIRICQAGEEPELGPITVTGTAYKGRDIEIEAMLPDAQRVKFLIPADQQTAPPAVGADINLAWRPQRALLVAEAGTAEP
jgi:spermidine/putrescine transport system ATP-binding protein